jgi:Zn-dependent peptidase ImmA (M78 family)/transcriptional regulator with XRE-family HTH domain
MIAARLLQARKSRGWSLQRLAKEAGGIVTRQALNKYELGKDTPRSDVLLRLGDALGVPLGFFFRPVDRQISFSTPVCRKRADLLKSTLAAITAEGQEYVERSMELEAIMAPGPNAWPGLPIADLLVTTLDQAEDAAGALRSQWHLGLDAIGNLTEVLEEHGVKVLVWKGNDPKFDGLACWADDKVPVIVVKSGVPGDRQRSSLAHELGHLAMQLAPGVDPEKAAHRFSGAFLVPAETARRELGMKRQILGLEELLMLKREYGMSIQQWLYRAKDLSIIGQAYHLSWCRYLSARGWRVTEPGDPVPQERSDRIKRLALQALAEGLVTQSRAAGLSGVPLEELRMSVAG